MATHSNILASGIPWTEDPCLFKYFIYKIEVTFTFHLHALDKEMATHSSVLAWIIPGTGSLVGCHLWSRTESDMTEAT